MAIQITRRDLEEAYLKSRDVLAFGEKHKGRGEKAVGVLASQAEGGLAAFGFGVLEAWKGVPKLGPLHLDLVLGVAGHGAAFLGLAGKNDDHLHNVSQGLLTGFFARMGLGLGATLARNSAQAAAQVAPVATTPVVSGLGRGGSIGSQRMHRPLTTADVAAMARSIR